MLFGGNTNLDSFPSISGSRGEIEIETALQRRDIYDPRSSLLGQSEVLLSAIQNNTKTPLQVSDAF